MASGKNEGMELLRNIPAFCEYAHRGMVSDPDFWRREAQFADGIMRAVAVAVIEIGGDQK